MVQFQGQPQVYQVRLIASGLALGWISSAADFRSASFQWSQVHLLPNGIPRPTDKYWLASGYGGGPENSTSTPWNARGIPAPASIPVTESMPGSGLIRYPGQSAIYLITKESQGRDFRVRWIPSGQDFAAWGYNWQSVQTVHYLPYPVGTPLTVAPQ
ncbi:MAG: hypothetical protein M1318_05900 [Firmicutes bacterium]|nr:hypothetical protein [Bacillota bacterium]